jgi:hypothetical protein
MFTHPSLLRQLTLVSDHLRRAGESDWARRVVQAADRLRKTGWTDSGKQALQDLFETQPTLDSVNFGAEHERRLGGRLGVLEANERFIGLRVKLKELGTLPLRTAPQPGVPRLRSPDLA